MRAPATTSFTLLFLLSCLSASAATDMPETISKNISRGQANTDENVVEETITNRFTLEEVKEIEEPKAEVYDYKHEVLLNFIQAAHERADSASYAPGKEVDFAKRPQPVVSDPNDNGLANSRSTDPGRTVIRAYCEVARTKLVSNKTSAKFLCKNKENGLFEMVVDLVPDNTNFALMAFGKYFINEDGEIIPIDPENSLITNSYSDDTNIATEVNTRKIEKFNAVAAKQTAIEMSAVTKEYMEQLKSSKQTQEQAPSGISGTVVTTTNTEKPDAGEYLAYGFVNSVLAIVEATAASFEEKLPYLYKLQKNTVLNAVIVTKQEKK